MASDLAISYLNLIYRVFILSSLSSLNLNISMDFHVHRLNYRKCVRGESCGERYLEEPARLEIVSSEERRRGWLGSLGGEIVC